MNSKDSRDPTGASLTFAARTGAGPLAGVFWVLAAATFWGFSGTLAKGMFNRALSPLLVVETRVIFAFVIFAAALAITRQRGLAIPPGRLFPFAILGVVGIAGSNFTYYFTIRELGVASAILLQYTAPVLVAAWGTLVEGEPATPRRFAALALALAGCALAVGGGGAGVRLSSLGLATGAASAFCYAFFNIYGRRHALRGEPWPALFYMFGFASLFWIAIIPFQPPLAAGLGASDWTLLAGFAVVSVLLPYICYYRGLARIAAERAITLSTWEPIVAILSAAILLGEPLGAMQIAGAAAVLAAVALIAREGQTPGSAGLVSRSLPGEPSNS